MLLALWPEHHNRQEGVIIPHLHSCVYLDSERFSFLSQVSQLVNDHAKICIQVSLMPKPKLLLTH